jgi:hypothetical protein
MHAQTHSETRTRTQRPMGHVLACMPACLPDCLGGRVMGSTGNSGASALREILVVVVVVPGRSSLMQKTDACVVVPVAPRRSVHAAGPNKSKRVCRCLAPPSWRCLLAVSLTATNLAGPLPVSLCRAPCMRIEQGAPMHGRRPGCGTGKSTGREAGGPLCACACAHAWPDDDGRCVPPVKPVMRLARLE